MKALACAGLLASPAARADDAACIASSEQALTLRHARQAARGAPRARALRADRGVPGRSARAECSRRIDEVRGAQPTLILAAHDGAGNDLSDVQVALDGAPLVTALEGLPVVVDPGEHTFTFRAAGQAPVERTLVVREGEKNRREGVVLVPPPAPPPVVPAPAALRPRAALVVERPQATIALVSAGAGVVGVALGAGWGAYAVSSQNREKGDCSKAACPRPAQAGADYTTATQDATASTVAFIAGGALLAAGAAGSGSQRRATPRRAPPRTRCA